MTPTAKNDLLNRNVLMWAFSIRILMAMGVSDQLTPKATR